MERHFIENHIQRASNMRRCSTLLATRNMSAKIAVKYHYIHIELATIKNKSTRSNVSKMQSNWSTHVLLMRTLNEIDNLGNSLEVLKLNLQHGYDQTVTFLNFI